MTVRWGLLGCGDIAAKRVADAIVQDEGSTLVAACRRDQERLREFGERFRIENLTVSADELITRDDLDAIYIATPVHLHCRQTIAAAEAGKHVLVEKPMALDPDQCQLMIDACQKANVNLGVAYYRRFYPAVNRIAEWIRTGRLGRLLSISAVTGNPNRFPADDWRVVKTLGGGGPLMDIGSHRLDLFLQLFGDVTRVMAACPDSPDYDAEESAALVVTFQNGAHGVLQCLFGAVDTPDRLEVIGTDGRVTVDDLNAGDLQCWTAEGSTTESHPPDPNFHAPLIADFAASLRDGRPPRVTGQTGMQTNLIIDQAYRSDCS